MHDNVFALFYFVTVTKVVFQAEVEEDKYNISLLYK